MESFMLSDLEDINNVVLLLTRLQNLCEGFDKTSKSAIITSKIKVLLAISENDGVATSSIQEKVGLAKSNITSLCVALSREGLISRTRDTFDTREVILSLTDAGKNYLNKFLKKAKKNFESELAYKDNAVQIRHAVTNLLKLID